jgi:hypothetical protein
VLEFFAPPGGGQICPNGFPTSLTISSGGATAPRSTRPLRGPKPPAITVPASGCPASARAVSRTGKRVRLSSLRVRPRVFRPGHKRPSLGRRRSRAAVISFRLSSRARVRLVFEKRAAVPCRGKTRRTRCVRRRRSGTLTVRGRAGRNRIFFDGALRRGRALRPGRYRLAAKPVAAAAKLKRTGFSVLGKRR